MEGHMIKEDMDQQVLMALLHHPNMDSTMIILTDQKTFVPEMREIKEDMDLGILVSKDNKIQNLILIRQNTTEAICMTQREMDFVHLSLVEMAERLEILMT